MVVSSRGSGYLTFFVAMYLCICILHFLHTLVFALCIFITNLYLYLYLWESLVVSNRSRGFLAVFVSSLWSTLPRAHSRRSRFILPDFDFDFISYFILFYFFILSSLILILILFLISFYFLISSSLILILILFFIWSTSRIESFQTLSSFLMDSMTQKNKNMRPAFL